MRRALAALFLVPLLGCMGPGTPIPVRGNLDAMVGEWRGEYASPETGRVGSIVFNLRAGTDTASGDVLMLPANAEPPAGAPREIETGRRPPQLLRVSFVRCEGSAVTGWIEAYPDPDTGERILTTFDGLLEGDRIEGTYVSYAELSNRRTSGTWKVQRKGPPRTGGGPR